MLAKWKVWWLPVLVWIGGSGIAHAGQANPFVQLVQQKRFQEAGRAIDARLARHADDPAALAARAELMVARAAPGTLAQAHETAQRCVRANPDSSLCAEALGIVLAAQARAGGLLGKVRHARAIRDAFERAILLDPMNYRARVALLRLYLATPFFLGGSETRARELASEALLTNPDLTRLLRALCALDEGKLDDAEQYLLAADLGAYPLVRDSQRELLLTLASAHLDAGRLARSARLFGELARRLPDSEHGPYGLALVARAQGRLADATRHLERAVALAPRPYIFKTLGELYEARRDRPRAIAAYQAALTGMPPLERRELRQVTAHLAQLREP